VAGAATEDRALLGRTDRAAGLAAAVAVAASSAEPVGQAELAGLAVMEATVTGAATQETAAMVAGSASAGHHPISSLVRRHRGRRRIRGQRRGFRCDRFQRNHG
jgi:hypothetical protein